MKAEEIRNRPQQAVGSDWLWFIRRNKKESFHCQEDLQNTHIIDIESRDSYRVFGLKTVQGKVSESREEFVTAWSARLWKAG